MMAIGLTGSIATGKSTVLAAFGACGAAIFSADQAVHALYEGEAVAAVGALFPDAVVDQRIDRARLGAELARNPARIGALEAVVHPLVRQRIAAFLAQAEADRNLIAVVEVPLLFETGHDYGFGRIAVTTCAPDIQSQRIMARPGMTVEKRDAILARQLPQDEKKRRADYVFDTSESIATTTAMVRALVASFQAREAQQQ